MRSRVLTGRTAGPTAIITVLVGLLAACSSSATNRAADTGATAKQTPVALSRTVPTGTTLRVGDQLG